MFQRHGREILELVLVKMVLLVMFLTVRGGYRSATADVVARGFDPILEASAATEGSTAVSGGSPRVSPLARMEFRVPGSRSSSAESEFESVVPVPEDDGRESPIRVVSDSGMIFP